MSGLIRNFSDYTPEQLQKANDDLGLDLDLNTLSFLQRFYAQLERDPLIDEAKMLSGYVAKCKKRLSHAVLTSMQTNDGELARTYRDFIHKNALLNGEKNKPITSENLSETASQFLMRSSESIPKTKLHFIDEKDKDYCYSVAVDETKKTPLDRIVLFDKDTPGADAFLSIIAERLSGLAIVRDDFFRALFELTDGAVMKVDALGEGASLMTLNEIQGRLLLRMSQENYALLKEQADGLGLSFIHLVTVQGKPYFSFITQNGDFTLPSVLFRLLDLPFNASIETQNLSVEDRFEKIAVQFPDGYDGYAYRLSGDYETLVKRLAYVYADALFYCIDRPILSVRYHFNQNDEDVQNVGIYFQQAMAVYRFQAECSLYADVETIDTDDNDLVIFVYQKTTKRQHATAFCQCNDNVIFVPCPDGFEHVKRLKEYLSTMPIRAMRPMDNVLGLDVLEDMKTNTLTYRLTDNLCRPLLEKSLGWLIETDADFPGIIAKVKDIDA